MTWVVVIEPDPAVRNTISTALREEPFEAVVVGELSEARRHLGGRTPALILADLFETGNEGVQELRAIWPGVPLIETSGTFLLAEPGEIALRKPFTGSTLRRAIRAALGSS